MSISAISWVLSQDIARSSEKFLLVCLANYADERGVCYPSQARLERDTGQDRKTIISNLKHLIEMGLLRDTGHRTGPTKMVNVYQIIGLPEASKRHYVYKLTDPATGRFYFGKRSFDGDPEQDTYRGSGKWPLDCAKNGTILVREIVMECPTSGEALAAESQALRIAQTDPKCMNLEAPIHRKKSNCPKNGTVPFFPSNCPVFPVELSQKRDIEPSLEPSVEPSVEKPAAKGRGNGWQTMREFLTDTYGDLHPPLPKPGLNGHIDLFRKTAAGKGLSLIIMEVLWSQFCHYYMTAKADKRQRNWHQHFLNAYMGNWSFLRLTYHDNASGETQLNSEGRMAYKLFFEENAPV